MAKNVSLTSKDLNRIVEKNVKPTIWNYLKNKGIGYSNDIVDEVISDFYFKLASNIDKYDANRSKGAWFSTIALHCTYDYFKKENRWNKNTERMIFKDEEGDYCEMEYYDSYCSDNERADNVIISRERMNLIERVIASLSKKEARILELKIEGCSNEEIGKELGISDGALRTRISRIRKKLLENPVIAELCTEVFGRAYSNAA